LTSTTPHQALYRRWRAQTFAEIVGQEAVVRTLRNAVRSNQVAQALLFVGPRGTGKTSVARIVAKALNCTDLRDGDPCDRCEACSAIREGRALDLIEIDAASNRGINEVRALRESLPYAPTDLRRKVFILDEAHQITKDAWNALLKSLEEPPEHVTFIFASTEPSGFPAAILSRLQRFDFRRLTVPQIEGKLRMILEADARVAEPEAIGLVARLAAGGMRDAESMLDQLLSSGAERLTADQVRELLGLAAADTVDAFVRALVAGDALAGIAILDELETTGRDLRSFLDQVVEGIRSGVVDSLAPADGRSPRSGIGTAGLAAAGRRLAGIDPTGAGPGGLRFQLEIALLAPPAEQRDARVSVPASTGAAPVPAASRPDSAEPRTPAIAPAQSPRIAATIAATDPTPAAAVGTSPAAAGQPTARRTPPPTRRSASAPPPPDGPVAPEPVAVGPGAPESESALDELRRHWPEIVAHISQHPPTKPLIAACRPIAVEGNAVVLGFPEEQAFLKDLLERRRDILEEGVGRFLGRAVAVRCVATNLDLVAPAPVDEAATRLLAEARRIFADDLLDVGEVG